MPKEDEGAGSPSGPGYTPEEIQRMAQYTELGGGFGRGRFEDDEGAELYESSFVLLERIKPKEKTVDTEKLKEAGENFDSALAYDIETMLSNYADLYSPADWELKRELGDLSRTVRRFERRIKSLERAKVTDARLDVAKSAYEKLKWAEGIETVLAGCMISTATYYAEEVHLANIPKVKVTGELAQAAFFKDLEGLDTKEHSEYLVSRDEIIKMQDDAMQISLMIGAVHQTEHENINNVSDASPLVPVKTPRERKEMALTSAQRKFIVEAFATRYEEDVKNEKGEVIHGKGEIITTGWVDPRTGKAYPVPVEIMNYFCMDKLTDTNRRRLLALMTSAVRMGALDKINSGEDSAVVANTVRTNAYGMVERDYFSPNHFQDTKERYANITVRSIIAKHLGDMSGGELGWGWYYEKTNWSDLKDWEKEMFAKSKEVEIVDVNGVKTSHEYVVLRVSKLGSIFSVDDIPSPFFPERHVADYQANVESTSEMMWGLADMFRREVRYHRPDWSPSLEEYCSWNPYLKEQVDSLFSGAYEAKISRNGVTFGAMDERLKKYMRQYKRAWPTWVTINGKPYAIPLFYPPVWYSLNVYRSMGDGGKDVSEVPSEMERMWEGRKLSEIDYRKFSDQVTDWKNVNGAQLARVLVLLFLSYKFSREGQQAYETYFTKVFDSKAFTDWEKRWRLGGRGEDAIAGILGLLSFAPFSTKVVLEKEELGKLGDPVATTSQKLALRTALDRSLATMELNAMYQPETKGTKKAGLKNLRGALGIMHRFYGNIETDWMLKSTLQTHDDLRQTEVNVGRDIDQVFKNNDVRI